MLPSDGTVDTCTTVTGGVSLDNINRLVSWGSLRNTDDVDKTYETGVCDERSHEKIPFLPWRPIQIKTNTGNEWVVSGKVNAKYIG